MNGLTIFNSGCRLLLSGFKTSLCSGSATSLHSSAPVTAIPLLYPNHKMDKDIRIRKEVKGFVLEKTCLVALKRAKILPVEIRDDATQIMYDLPLNAHWTRMRARCLVTSRGRAVVRKWKLSRIVWRLEADYNKMSGVQRAMWT